MSVNITASNKMFWQSTKDLKMKPQMLSDISLLAFYDPHMLSLRMVLCICLLITSALASGLYSDEVSDRVTSNLPPLDPHAALNSFHTRSGFRIELVASEPLIRSPVAIDFDAQARLYVVEAPEYNQYAGQRPSELHGAVKR